MTKRSLVAFGLAGLRVDAGSGPDRWDSWRPTVAACRHPDLLIDRFELLYGPEAEHLVATLTADIGSVSPETTVRPWPVTIADPWDFEATYGTLFDFVSAYPFAPDREDYLVHITTGSHVWQICLFLLAETRHLPARLLQTSPPRWSDAGGPGSHQIIDLDLARYDRLKARFERQVTASVDRLKSGIATRNDAFNRMIERIETVALASADPLLLLGPTGAGKSQLARRIYELKQARRQVSGPFVEVNCATVRGDGAMSTLFGHRRGAFTGAVSDRPGLLKAADGGVLFLDELGELGLDEQAMLLRCLEDKRFLPVGSDREVGSDFQLIAGSNRELLQEVVHGRFRADLLARIDIWTFRIPGLAERREDVEPNLDYELDRFADSTGRRVGFNREARDRYLAFATSADATWAANFRDLSGSIRRMATLAPEGRISEPLVAEEIDRLIHAWRLSGDHAGDDDQLLAALLGEQRLQETDPFDRVQLAEVVRVCRRSPTLSVAGRHLFRASRRNRTSTNDADRLRKYLARFGLEFAALGETQGS